MNKVVAGADEAGDTARRHEMAAPLDGLGAALEMTILALDVAETPCRVRAEDLVGTDHGPMLPRSGAP